MSQPMLALPPTPSHTHNRNSDHGSLSTPSSSPRTSEAFTHSNTTTSHFIPRREVSLPPLKGHRKTASTPLSAMATGTTAGAAKQARPGGEMPHGLGKPVQTPQQVRTNAAPTAPGPQSSTTTSPSPSGELSSSASLHRLARHGHRWSGWERKTRCGSFPKLSLAKARQCASLPFFFQSASWYTSMSRNGDSAFGHGRNVASLPPQRFLTG